MINFTTNLDAYKTNCFPTKLQHVPRVGEYVSVVYVFRTYFAEKKLPTRLQVVSVTHTEEGVICELTYGDIDIQIMKANGVSGF